MNEQIELIEGTTRNTELSQYFTTPDLAQRVVEWAYVPDLDAPRVLEPSAGNGALVRPLVAAGAWVAAVEIDRRYDQELFDAGAGYRIYGADFLKLGPESLGSYDLCVMNPPYERTEQCPQGQDVAFILHALKFAPRVVGIFTDRILFGVERKEGLWSKVRPTRIAFQSRRPFKGAQTDYVVLELVACPVPAANALCGASLEWW